MNIILASKSPRRKDLLERINLKFDIIDSSFDENKVKISNNIPHKYCMKLAEYKCKSVSEKHIDSLVIGSDTIVYHNKQILDKPKNKSEAKKHLNMLSDNTHIVYTGVFLSIKAKDISIPFYEKSYVTFHKLSNQDIDYYIEHFKPYDKAGSYGIQDWSMVFVKKINGCFNNVVGFPVSKFFKLGLNNSTINQIIKENLNT